MIFIGIDPGFSGAIAFLEPGSGNLTVTDMPVAPNTKGKNELNLHSLATELYQHPHRCITMIEKVHAMPNQGVSSVFRFGQGFGAIQMAVTGHGHEVHYVSPAAWKKYFKLSKDKGVSRSLAAQRFPQAADLFSRVEDDGRAEAALIALYAKETVKI